MTDLVMPTEDEHRDAAALATKRKRGESDAAYIERLVELAQRLDLQCARNADSYDELFKQRQELSAELVELRNTLAKTHRGGR